MGILLDIDPLLEPLADNGGLTLTHALQAGSPAIDAGDPSALAGVGNVPLYDQREATFDRVVDGGSGGARIDIGAYEKQSSPDILVSTSSFLEIDEGQSAFVSVQLATAPAGPQDRGDYRTSWQ